MQSRLEVPGTRHTDQHESFTKEKSERQGLRLERSPHPYFRQHGRIRKSSSKLRQHVSTPGMTPPYSDSEDNFSRSFSRTGSPSDSGSEADDEGFDSLKALPAPPITPSKGLKTGESLHNSYYTSPSSSPALTSQPKKVKAYDYGHPQFSKIHADAAAKQRMRHRAESIRRLSEISFVTVVSGLSFAARDDIITLPDYYLCIASYTVLPLLLCFIYLARLSSDSSTDRSILSILSSDPAPILYPYVLPVAVAFSTRARDHSLLVANFILALTALPDAFLSLHGAQLTDEVHWAISIFPLLISRKLLIHPSSASLEPETLAVLFPLHRCLLQPLYYLTTSSLLHSEVHLLSIGFINMLLFSKTSTALILSLITWVGGIGTLVLCAKPLKWNVALERIPHWRFNRFAHHGSAKANLSVAPNDNGSPISSGNRNVSDYAGLGISYLQSSSQRGVMTEKLQYTSKRNQSRASFSAGDEKKSHNLTMRTENTGIEQIRIPRRQTLAATPRDLNNSRLEARHRRKPSISNTTYQYISMTYAQADRRKLIYTIYTYSIIVLLIAGPIRGFIGIYALNGYEPFGWALSYLFGDLALVKRLIIEYNLSSWSPLQKAQVTWNAIFLKALHPREYASTASNSTTFPDSTPSLRLYLLGYFVLALTMGLLTTFSLPPSIADVDTRRKIFHFTMVALLLPTVFLDPPFLALALVLVLSVFLLLELIRAAQLRPFSKPLARFLAPYVDGRDLRGPVVVSHIFLVIGCAIPLWLALAGVEHNTDDGGPWAGWTAATRDISMVAGVICVGMGDAAASLIGRRFGRHKWPWPGGKSLEGSTAFAISVTVGLTVAKAYLHAGGWEESYAFKGESWLSIIIKALAAACGASFTEAVLTGCNDNVVVPVVLWLLVRGLRL